MQYRCPMCPDWRPLGANKAQSLSMHNVRKHGTRPWHKADRPEVASKSSSDNLPRAGSMVDHMIRILREHPDGMFRRDIFEAVKKAGYKINSSEYVLSLIGQTARNHPEFFLTPRKGFYKLRSTMIERASREVDSMLAIATSSVAQPQIEVDEPLTREEMSVHLRYMQQTNHALSQAIIAMMSMARPVL